MKLEAEWTDDCQGKKNYDGNIVSISTRYWPRGGGFLLMTRTPGHATTFEDNDDRPEIKPSAKSHVTIWHDGDSTDLATKEFEGDTFEEVESQVESWAQEQFEKVVAAVKTVYADAMLEARKAAK